MESKQIRVNMKKMTERQLFDYQRSCKQVADIMGRSTLVEGLKTRDFHILALKLADGVSKVTFANRFRLARALFLYAADSDLIPKRLNFGQNFAIPDKAEMRVEKQKRGPMDFTADELRKITAAAGFPLQAMILLGINAGFGSSPERPRQTTTSYRATCQRMASTNAHQSGNANCRHRRNEIGEFRLLVDELLKCYPTTSDFIVAVITRNKSCSLSILRENSQIYRNHQLSKR